MTHLHGVRFYEGWSKYRGMDRKGQWKSVARRYVMGPKMMVEWTWIMDMARSSLTTLAQRGPGRLGCGDG